MAGYLSDLPALDVKQGPRAIDNLIDGRPADFMLALMEAIRIDKEGHALQ